MKKIIVAALLLFLSVNLFPLIPWEVTLYQGKVAAIVQSPGKTELRITPGDLDDPGDSKPDVAQDVDTLLTQLLENADAMVFGSPTEASRSLMPRLDKIYIPAFRGSDTRLELVRWTSGAMRYEFAGESQKNMVYVCGGENCETCTMYKIRFDKLVSNGDMDSVVAVGKVKARFSSTDSNVLQAFGEKNGAKFHAVIAIPEGVSPEKALSQLYFKTYYPSYAPLVLFRLAEAGRIACVAAFVTGIVLLVLELVPLRKKQTIPDG